MREAPKDASVSSEIDPPRNVEEVESSETSLTLRWQKPQAKISTYRLVYVSRDGQVEEELIPSSATSYVMSNLTPGMSYSMTLTAERGLKRSKPVSHSATTGGWKSRFIPIYSTNICLKYTMYTIFPSH